LSNTSRTVTFGGRRSGRNDAKNEIELMPLHLCAFAFTAIFAVFAVKPKKFDFTLSKRPAAYARPYGLSSQTG